MTFKASFQEVMRIMNKAAVRIAQIQALENGKGVQYLIDEAYKILKNPLLLHNMEYELLYCTKNVNTDDRLWNEIVENGVFSDDSIRFFLEECFIDDVANSKTITFLISDKLKYERLYGRVFNGYNDTVADLIAVACDRPLQAHDAMIFEAVCVKLSQEINSSTFYKQYGIHYHEKLICKLLDAGINNKVIYSGHLSNLYEGLKTNLYVVLADIGESTAAKIEPDKCINELKDMQPEFKYAFYNDYIVIIASNNKTSLHVNKDLHQLSEYFNAYNIRIGISSGFDNLFNLRKYFIEAANTFNLKQKHSKKAKMVDTGCDIK